MRSHTLNPPKVIAQWVGGINYAEYDASTLAGIVAQTQLRAKHHQATLWLHHFELPYPVPASGLELGFHCWAQNTRQAWSHSRQPRLCWHKALYTKVYLSSIGRPKWWKSSPTQGPSRLTHRQKAPRNCKTGQLACHMQSPVQEPGRKRKNCPCVQPGKARFSGLRPSETPKSGRPSALWILECSTPKCALQRNPWGCHCPRKTVALQFLARSLPLRHQCFSPWSNQWLSRPKAEVHTLHCVHHFLAHGPKQTHLMVFSGLADGK